MKVTYFGTTVLLFDDGKDQILFDCQLTRPCIFKAFFLPLSTDVKFVDYILDAYKINRLKGIFISHTHYDHCLDMPYVAKKTHCNVYGSFSAVNLARGNEVQEEHLIQYNPGAVYEIGSYRITVLKSLHSKPMWFNNDIGKEIDKPLSLPAGMKAFKEGGSCDFLVENSGKRYLIRPSFNYLSGELNNITADYLFQSVTHLSRVSSETVDKFFDNTISLVKPKVIIPVHWDNMFTKLYKGAVGIPFPFERLGKSFLRLTSYCNANNINCLVQIPLSQIEI